MLKIHQIFFEQSFEFWPSVRRRRNSCRRRRAATRAAGHCAGILNLGILRND